MVAKPRYCSKSLQKQESLRKRNNSTSSTSKQKNIRIVKLNCRVKSNCQRNPQTEIEPAKCEQNLQNISGIHLLLWNPRTICWVRKTTSYFCSLQYPWQNKCAVKFYAIHSWAEIPFHGYFVSWIHCHCVISFKNCLWVPEKKKDRRQFVRLSNAQSGLAKKNTSVSKLWENCVFK